MRGKRNFTTGELDGLVATLEDDQDDEDPLDFNRLSNSLIADAASANSHDQDIVDAIDDIVQPLTITILPLNPAARSALRPVAVKVSMLFQVSNKWDGQVLEREDSELGQGDGSI